METMRRDVLDWAIYQLKTEKMRFDMGSWFEWKEPASIFDKIVGYSAADILITKGMDRCDTAGCLAGTVVASMPWAVLRKWKNTSIHEVARVQFGISNYLSKELFNPPYTHTYSREAAIKVLENIRDKGYLDWGEVAAFYIKNLAVDEGRTFPHIAITLV